jgi:hypothetical protein
VVAVRILQTIRRAMILAWFRGRHRAGLEDGPRPDVDLHMLILFGAKERRTGRRPSAPVSLEQIISTPG